VRSKSNLLPCSTKQHCITLCNGIIRMNQCKWHKCNYICYIYSLLHQNIYDVKVISEMSYVFATCQKLTTLVNISHIFFVWLWLNIIVTISNNSFRLNLNAEIPPECIYGVIWDSKVLCEPLVGPSEKSQKTNGETLRYVITYNVIWVIRRLNLLCIAGNAHLCKVWRNERTFPHLIGHRTSFQAFCRYVVWKTNLKDHSLYK